MDFAGFSLFPDKSNSLCLDFLFNNVVYAKHLLSFWNFGRCQTEGAYIRTAYNRNLGYCISTKPYLGKEITLILLTFSAQIISKIAIFICSSSKTAAAIGIAGETACCVCISLGGEESIREPAHGLLQTLRACFTLVP